MSRHSSVGEFRQEHGNKPWQAPFCPQLVWADSCQPQDVFWYLSRLSLEHSTLAQTKGRRSQTTEACWDGQTYTREETSPS